MANEVTWSWSNVKVSPHVPGSHMFTLSDEMRFMLGLIELNSIEDIERYLAS